ncbi:RTA1 domain-containing protein [Aspergillus ruber CBS 135680]|uniref:RTA1-domain-containing protein n=1 Tax=Aspergillus ruber (strain CBS 135680) TaxID=1388766 RepID=A0A017SDC7_ASPRC|nr:RTA1-domain-containing protein [Aspergillus ruber CBS 135680]EYE94952.1 RTA1-domain-containing protein [Aspergillus ruber CBS 135680]
MSASASGGFKAYEYDPSMAAAVIFIILYIVVTFLHTYNLFQTRTWFFIPLVLGGYFELVGYIGRAMSAHETPNWTLGPYVMQSTLLLVAPALFAASIYMELGRIIHLVKGQKFALIRVNWMTKIFVAGDVLSFLMQASGLGAGIMVKGSQSTGNNIIIGGLIVQIIFFGFFVICSIVFQVRIISHPTTESVADCVPWKKHLYALYATSILILIRSIFRVAEYVQGSDGYLLSTEVFIYIFDATLMFLVMVVFIIIHPSEINCLLGRGRKMTTKGGLKLNEVSSLPL